MNKPVPYFSEIISLAVMMLMVIALVAGEADATIHRTALRAEAVAEERLPDTTTVPFTTTINAEVAGHPLTIAINASAELNLEAVRQD